MRFLPEYLNSVDLYWLMNNLIFLIFSIYIYKKSKKNVINMISSLSLFVMFSHQIIDRVLLLIGFNIIDRFNYAFYVALSFFIYIIIFKNRYKWERLKSDKYDPNKVQAIYSKPNSLLCLFGAVISFSPKCSVRYTYNDKSIRFKKSYLYPLMFKTTIKQTDIIKDTKFTPKEFFSRWELIKSKKYNIFTFNCKHLIK